MKTRSSLIIDGLELIGRGLKTAGGVSDLYIGRRVRMVTFIATESGKMASPRAADFISGTPTFSLVAVMMPAR